MLDLRYCQQRQARLLAVMEEQGLDLVVLSNPKTVHYFSGALVDPTLPQAFGIASSGKTLLATNAEPRQAAAETVHLYTAYTIERVFSRTTMSEEVRGCFGNPARAAREFEFVNYGGGEIDITPFVAEMRRRKDPDELAAMRATTRLVEAAYAAIKPRLEPGLTEYQAFSIMQDALIQAAQTSVTLVGDFAFPGGPPTARKLEAGDLYILDIFPLYEGYMCDLCRTFCVGRPSALQQETWAHIMQAHEVARRALRPGAVGRDVYHAVREHLEAYPRFRGSFTHHLGHGVGMDGWEFPWITPGSDQRVQEGDVIAIEPGLYGEELGGGIRLEHNYVVAADGLTALDEFPMEL